LVKGIFISSLWICTALLSGCGQSEVRHFDADKYPQELSDWGIIELEGAQLIVNDSAMVYALNTGLFSDYALKLRTVFIPEGQSADYHPEDTFAMPVGSVISKTFFYPKDSQGRLMITSTWKGNPMDVSTATHQLVETRLLVKHASGWDAVSYFWQGDEAYLSVTGKLQRFTLANDEPLNYLVPSRNQCASCHATNHTTGEIRPIGIKARHLNRATDLYQANQLTHWQNMGILKGVTDPAPANALWNHEDAGINHKARSYLDINCGHCHNSAGAADTSGLLLDYADHPKLAMGYCKPPIAAGRGSGGRLYSIVPGHPEASILSFRLETNNPAMMMPELGRSLVHSEGVELISSWITTLEGECI
jgi:uncharacterized repeat protein (TIGR03806 family)